MASSTVPGKKRPTVVVDWIYIRYRTLLLVTGAAIVLVALGLWSWRTTRGSVTEEQATAALTAAEQVVEQAGRVAPSAELLPEAREHLDKATAALGRRAFPETFDEAGSAERIGREIVASHHPGGEPGVRVVRVDGDVRVKRAGVFTWESVPDRSQVELKTGDQIKTGSEGSAQLVYFDGTMMTISPGTLLEIRELFRDQARRTQRVSERLAWGQLQAQTQETDGYESVHEVATESAAVQASRASEFQVRHDRDNRRSEVVAQRGALMLTVDSRKMAVPESTRVAVAAGQVVERSQLLEPPRQEAPPDQKTFAGTAEAAVSLAWAPVEHASGYRVQLSERPLFSPAAPSDRRVSGLDLKLPVLSAGAYYWRVAALDAQGREGRWSESRKFRVLGGTAVFKDPDDHKPPPLDINEIMVVGSNAIVSGRCEPGALVWIEGERVDLEDDGRFTWVVKLHQDGENKIHFLAQDAAGNETRKVGKAFLDAF